MAEQSFLHKEEAWIEAEQLYTTYVRDPDAVYKFAYDGKLLAFIIYRGKGHPIDYEKALKYAFKGNREGIIGYIYGVTNKQPVGLRVEKEFTEDQIRQRFGLGRKFKLINIPHNDDEVWGMNVIEEPGYTRETYRLFDIDEFESMFYNKDWSWDYNDDDTYSAYNKKSDTDENWIFPNDAIIVKMSKGKYLTKAMLREQADERAIDANRDQILISRYGKPFTSQHVKQFDIGDSDEVPSGWAFVDAADGLYYYPATPELISKLARLEIISHTIYGKSHEILFKDDIAPDFTELWMIDETPELLLMLNN